MMMRARAAIVLALVAACSGTAAVRDHAEATVADTHCRDHACATRPTPRLLGDGCYVVGDALYQCSTDELPAGAVSCFEIRFCAGTCDYHKTDALGREVSTQQCRDRWAADRQARHVREPAESNL